MVGIFQEKLLEECIEEYKEVHTTEGILVGRFADIATVITVTNSR